MNQGNKNTAIETVSTPVEGGQCDGSIGGAAVG